MSGKENENKSKYQAIGFQSKILLMFSAVLVLLCAFLFIYYYGDAYSKNTNGGYFSARDGLIFKHAILILFALLASVVLKKTLKHRLALRSLIIVSIVLPILCYNINYHTFKKDAVLYPTVNEGGVFHFITIHDFNFDGVDDGYDYTGDDVRELSHTDYGASPEDVVSAMDYTIIGKGGKLDSSHCQYVDGTIKISLYKSRVTYDHIKITLSFKDSADAQRASLYLFDSKLETTLESDTTVSVTFDAEACAKWQQASLQELIVVSINCVLDE